MTQEQVFETGRITLADQNLRLASRYGCGCRTPGISSRATSLIATATSPTSGSDRSRRRSDAQTGRSTPMPHTQIAFWNGGAWDTVLEKSADDDPYLFAMDFNDLRAVLCRLEVPEQDEESLRDRLGVPLPYDHGRHDFGPV
jgi:hypothetical protein